MISFTVVIPTFNRPQQLRLCLEALTTIAYPADGWEVVVVDDGSSQPLDEIVEPFFSRLNMRLLRKPNGGPAGARNLGVNHAHFDYIALTDDDCRPDPNWLHAMAKTLQEHPHALVGGYTINALVDNPYAAASQLIVDIVYRHYNPNPNAATFFTSNNMAMSKQDFLAVGAFNALFDKAAAEDRDFCDRWRFSGRPMLYQPNALMYHAHYMTLKKYLRQHFDYGRGAYRFHLRRAERHSGTFATETRFHFNIANWLIDPIARTHGAGEKVIMFTLLMAWQLANAAGYFAEMRRQRFGFNR
jgi:glycosyltransferase involved in cell wall biosynthesis